MLVFPTNKSFINLPFTAKKLTSLEIAINPYFAVFNRFVYQKLYSLFLRFKNSPKEECRSTSCIYNFHDFPKKHLLEITSNRTGL